MESNSEVSAIEDYIYSISANGESIKDYAFIYIRKNEEDERVELK